MTQPIASSLAATWAVVCLTLAVHADPPAPATRPAELCHLPLVTSRPASLPADFCALPLVSSRPAEAPALPPPASQPFRLDPARYLGVDQVRPGMKGLGRSVFSQTELKEFQVEVISVVRNFAPQMDMILIRCAGANLEHTGIIAGMSGSPIYLHDPADGNKLKMIGALAYGWPLNKDPIAGVQPIAQMLNIPEPGAARASPRVAAGTGGQGAVGEVALAASGRRAVGQSRFAPVDILPPAPQAAAPGPDQPRLTPLMTPLMVSGANAAMMDLVRAQFAGGRLMPVQSGGGGAASQPALDARIVPGAVLAVPVMWGDVEMTAIGTVTEVDGDKVWGFGHSFFASGKTALPLATGFIHTVMPSINISFKMGSALQQVGTLYVDEETAVVSKFGPPPAPVPMTVRVANDAGPQTYRYFAVQHDLLTPQVAAMSTVMSVLAHRNLPPEYSTDYRVTMSFDNGRTVTLADRNGLGDGAPRMLSDTLGALMLVTQNDFARAKLTALDAEISIVPEWRYVEVLSSRALRTRLRPGEPLQVALTLRPVRGEPYSKLITVPLPRDLPEGAHTVTLASGRDASHEALADQPALTSPRDADELFRMLDLVARFRSDRLYARVRKPGAGLSIAGVNLPALPASRAAILRGADRGGVLPYYRSAVSEIDLGTSVSAAMSFEITIDRHAVK